MYNEQQQNIAWMNMMRIHISLTYIYIYVMSHTTYNQFLYTIIQTKKKKQVRCNSVCVCVFGCLCFTLLPSSLAIGCLWTNEISSFKYFPVYTYIRIFYIFYLLCSYYYYYYLLLFIIIIIIISYPSTKK